MEIRDFKKTISIYDDNTINELIKSIKEARKEIEKYAQRENEIKEERKAKGKEISVEEKEEYKSRIKQVKEECKPTKEYLSKMERKKNGLLTRLDKKIKEIEEKNSNMQKEIEHAKEIINANDKLAKDFGVESTGLEEEMQDLKDAISTRESKINKNVEKLNKLYRTFSDVKDEKEIEGLQPKVVRTYKSLPKDQIFKNSSKSVTKIVEIQRNETEIKKDNKDLEIENQIKDLEKEKRISAARMKEYRESGNYEQEAAEHVYYNGLVSEINNLKSKELETKEPIMAVKAEPSLKKEPVEPAKTVVAKPKETIKTVKIEPTPKKETVETAKTGVAKPKETIKTEKIEPTHKKEPAEPAKTEQKAEIKWNAKLTQEQIEELDAEGIKPGDNEYNLYLWNHGINPFEDQMKQKQEAPKSVVDPVLEKYKNDGFSKNAFGWYFNPRTDEFEEDYDPHTDPYFNEKLKEEKTSDKTEEKATKISLWKRFKNAIKKVINNAKRYIENINKKQLPEGTGSEQEKEEYVAKAEEILKETLSTDRVFDSKSREAMQGREKFLNEIKIPPEKIEIAINGDSKKIEKPEVEKEIAKD